MVYNPPVFGLGAPQAPSSLWASYPGLFSPEECAEVIALMAPIGEKSAGLVGGSMKDRIRTTQITWLAEHGPGHWVHQRLAKVISQANREHFGIDLDGFDEDAQIAKYQENGFYDWHSDRGGKGIGQRRKLTVSVQLSAPNDYQGGELELNPSGHVIQAPRSQGTATVFPAYTLHRVTPVTLGCRYSLVIWAHGPNFR